MNDSLSKQTGLARGENTGQVTGTTQVVVIGAGISGLACAHRLHQMGIDVQVFESDSEVGGSARSVRENGYLLELGPNSYTRKPEISELIEEIGLQNDLFEEPMRDHPRFLFDGNQLREVPSGPVALVGTPLLSTRAKLRLLKEPFLSARPADEESVADFFRRQVGPEILEMFVAPFVSGIYAGDPEIMSMPAAFPLIYDFAGRKGSVVRGALNYLKDKKKKRQTEAAANPNTKPKKRRPSALCSFREGLQQLPKTIASGLGERVHCGVGIDAVSLRETGSDHPFQVSASQNQIPVLKSKAVVLATPAYESARILKSPLPSAAQALEKIDYHSLTVVHAGVSLDSLDFKPRGFGFLVPRGRGVRALGVLWTSSVFEGRAPEGQTLLTVFYGGATDPEVTGLPDSELHTLAQKDLKTTMGWNGEEKLLRITRYNQALPSYRLGHLKTVDSLNDALAQAPGPVHVVGNYLRGISMPECVRRARELADELSTKVR